MAEEAKPDEGVIEEPIDAWVAKMREAPGKEFLVSLHDTKKGAQVRVSQMRRTAKWSKLPVALRAGEAPLNIDGRSGAVYATYTGIADDGSAPAMSFRLNLGGMPDEEAYAFLERVAAHMDGVLELPSEYVRVGLERKEDPR